MGKIRDELEDVSFMYLHPEEYQRIKAEVSDKYDWAMKQVESPEKADPGHPQGLKIKAEIQYRIKREISIFRKLQKQNIELENVYDLLALRVITDTVANCYVIMGAIHQQWVHIPGRWRDFITNPKSNFYQSIHTTIITREGVKFEIQIRTQEMHRNAEEGIAAHWKYKEGLAFLENDHRLEWFREMIDYHKTNPDPKEFLSLVKRDLTPNEIYVFTPKGKVVNLKAGSTPDRLRLRHPLRGRRPLQERHRQREAGAAAHPAELGRRGRDRHPEEQQPQRRLAEIRRHHPSQEKENHGYLQKEETASKGERPPPVAEGPARIPEKIPNLLHRPGHRAADRRIHYPDLETFLRDIGSGKKPLDRQTLKNLFPEVTAVEIKTVRKTPRKPSPDASADHRRRPGGHRFHFRQMLPPDQGRRDHRLYHQKPRPGHSPERLPQRQHGNPVENQAGLLEPDRPYAYKARFEIIIDDKPGMLSTITGITAPVDSNIKKIELEQANQTMVRITIIFEVRDTFQLNRIYEGLKSTTGVYSVIRKKVA